MSIRRLSGLLAGTVESVTEDSVNGTMITVDMGNGYKAVYGQMKDVNVKEGR